MRNAGDGSLEREEFVFDGYGKDSAMGHNVGVSREGGEDGEGGG